MLALPTELTQAQAAGCLKALAAGVRATSGKTVPLDAAPLQRFDSAALAVLLACQREAGAAGKHLLIQGMPAHLHDLAMLYGIAQLLDPDPAGTAA
ncbi:MAG: hypothetical protein RLZZ591_1320 [Pseudomonadota bacterium]|jgi:phospholipid transport system transporter-binding protein